MRKPRSCCLHDEAACLRLWQQAAARIPRLRCGNRRRARAKDEAFKSGSDSPVPENRRAELLPLAYFLSSRITRRLQL